LLDPRHVSKFIDLTHHRFSGLTGHGNDPARCFVEGISFANIASPWAPLQTPSRKQAGRRLKAFSETSQSLARRGSIATRGSAHAGRLSNAGDLCSAWLG
jgi:hypothetical protein